MLLLLLGPPEPLGCWAACVGREDSSTIEALILGALVFNKVQVHTSKTRTTATTEKRHARTEPGPLWVLQTGATQLRSATVAFQFLLEKASETMLRTLPRRRRLARFGCRALSTQYDGDDDDSHLHPLTGRDTTRSPSRKHTFNQLTLGRLTRAFRSRGHFAASLDPLRENEFIQHYKISMASAGGARAPRSSGHATAAHHPPHITATERSRWLPEEVEDTPDVFLKKSKKATHTKR